MNASKNKYYIAIIFILSASKYIYCYTYLLEQLFSIATKHLFQSIIYKK
jgi:hypothetical protein